MSANRGREGDEISRCGCDACGSMIVEGCVPCLTVLCVCPPSSVVAAGYQYVLWCCL